VPIAVHRWIIYVSLLFWVVILIFTDLVLSPAKFYLPTGWEHGYGPLFTVVPLYGLYLLLADRTNFGQPESVTYRALRRELVYPVENIRFLRKVLGYLNLH